MLSSKRGTRGMKAMTQAEAIKNMRFKGSRQQRKRQPLTGEVEKDKEQTYEDKNVVYDEKLGLKRNQVFGGGDIKVFQESNPSSSSYIDANRCLDGNLVDVKKAMRKAKKDSNLAKEHRRRAKVWQPVADKFISRKESRSIVE